MNKIVPIKAKEWDLFIVLLLTLNVTMQHMSHIRGGDNY